MDKAVSYVDSEYAACYAQGYINSREQYMRSLQQLIILVNKSRKCGKSSAKSHRKK